MSPRRTSEPRRPLRHRAALSHAARASLVRNAAHIIRRSGCCWRDQREDLGVGSAVRVTTQEAHPLAWSIACGGLRVGDGRSARSLESPARRRAWSCSSKAPRAAAGVHVVHGTLLESCWGLRRGGEAAGGRRRLQVCRRRRRSACAECERRRRASGGPAAEDHGARPKYKGRLARAVRIVCFACVPPRRPSAK